MKPQKTLTLLSWLVAALSLIAAGTGVLTSLLAQGGANSHYAFLTLRGETIQIWGTGLYRLDSAAGAAQVIGQDIVTLFIGIPLLIIASVLASRGLLRGQVLLAGTLGYFLYTYTSMAMLAAYNELFLLYVALMSLSLFAFVLALLSIDVATLPSHFTAQFPRRTIAGFALFLGAMLLLLWLKLIVPPLLAGTAPAGLDSYATLVIQALDLGFIVPTALLTGVLLLRRAALGYLLAAVVLILGLTMGAALLAMSIAQILAGAVVDPAALVIFTALAVVDAVLTILLLRSIADVPVAGQVIAGSGTPQRSPAPGAQAFAAAAYVPPTPPVGNMAPRIEATHKGLADGSRPQQG